MTSPLSENESFGQYLPQAAAIATLLVVSTNLFPLNPIQVPAPQIASAYQMYSHNPLLGATTHVVSPSMNTLDASTRISSSIATKWGSYVTRRITELLMGAHDFSGLQVPADKTGRRAWDLAVKLFHPNTPVPSVLPSENGEILFVWHKAGWDIEITVGSEETEVWAHNRRSGEEFSGSVEEFLPETGRTLADLALT